MTRALPLALLTLAGCTAPAPPPQVPPATSYRALGQEPGWSLTIGGGRIDYVGDYGETQISVPAPEPRTSFNGHRYQTPRLIVDITHGGCNDAMSGQAYADRVMVIADGKTAHGCGGDRVPAKDM